MAAQAVVPWEAVARLTCQFLRVSFCLACVIRLSSRVALVDSDGRSAIRINRTAGHARDN